MTEPQQKRRRTRIPNNNNVFSLTDEEKKFYDERLDDVLTYFNRKHQEGRDVFYFSLVPVVEKYISNDHYYFSITNLT